MLRSLFIIGVCVSLTLPATAQDASRDMLAKGMAMLDGTWAGNETQRQAVDDAMTETTSGTFESRMNPETYTATVTNGGQVFNVRVEEGALVASSAARSRSSFRSTRMAIGILQ